MPGRDFIAGRALAATQTSQAAGTAGCGSLPGCPVAFLPSEVPLLCGNDPFAIGDLPKEAVRALALLLHEAGVGQVQECIGGRGRPKEGRDPPEIV